MPRSKPMVEIVLPQNSLEANLQRGSLFLGNMAAVLSLGAAENPNNIGAVLSCLPVVNEHVNLLVSKAGILHHQYFHLDDHVLVRSPPDGMAIRLESYDDLADAAEVNSDSCVEDVIDNFDLYGPTLPSALAFVHDHLSAMRNVLIHCDGGVLRSPATTIAYLMRYRNMTLAAAKETVSRYRPEIHIRPLEVQLGALERSIQSYSSFSPTNHSKALDSQDADVFLDPAASQEARSVSPVAAVRDDSSNDNSPRHSQDNHLTFAMPAVAVPLSMTRDSDVGVGSCRVGGAAATSTTNPTLQTQEPALTLLGATTSQALSATTGSTRTRPSLSIRVHW